MLSVLPGEILDDRWRVESRIGQGAMGSVFKAKDLVENAPVAIKILAPEHCRKPKVLARFEREAELMTTLRHPNIVQIHAHGRRGALPYIAMEFLEGLTLAEVLQQIGGSMGLAETVAVVKQVASGLAFLHHHGLVHRDVKPQNVFMTSTGRVTILDLGVVRDLHNPGLTRPGAMVGTPYYMSPEQILGVDDIDKRTDVYALAAMTFELLTGRPPFLGQNNFEVLFGHKNTPPPSATDIIKTIPKQVSAVLIRGLAKRRDQRPESASELAFDLEAIAGMKKVDLAKTFPFLVKKKAPEKEKDKDRPKPKSSKQPLVRGGGSDVPMADSNDIVSLPNPEHTAPVTVALADPRKKDDSPRTQMHQPHEADGPRTRKERPHTPKLEDESGVIPKRERTHAGAKPKSERTNGVGTNARGSDAPALSTGHKFRQYAQAAEDEDFPHVDTDALRLQQPQTITGKLRVLAQMRGQAVKGLLIVDGTSRGFTPRTVLLTPGRHNVRIEKKGARPVERVIEVRADELMTIRLELPSA